MQVILISSATPLTSDQNPPLRSCILLKTAGGLNPPLGRHCPGSHPLGQTPLGRHPQADTPLGQTPQADPPKTVIAADGTHPTGMHSCCIYYFNSVYTFRIFLLKLHPATQLPSIPFSFDGLGHRFT